MRPSFSSLQDGVNFNCLFKRIGLFKKNSCNYNEFNHHRQQGNLNISFQRLNEQLYAQMLIIFDTLPIVTQKNVRQYTI